MYKNSNMMTLWIKIMNDKTLTWTKFKTISSCCKNGTNKERVRWSELHLRNWRQAYADWSQIIQFETIEKRWGDHIHHVWHRQHRIGVKHRQCVKRKLTLYDQRHTDIANNYSEENNSWLSMELNQNKRGGLFRWELQQRGTDLMRTTMTMFDIP